MAVHGCRILSGGFFFFHLQSGGDWIDIVLFLE